MASIVNTNRSGSILGYAAKVLSFLTVYVVVMSYGMNTAYYTSYLAKFGIDINVINFWPSLYDFMIHSTTMLAALFIGMVVFVVILIGLNKLSNLLERLAHSHQITWLESIVRGLKTPNISMLALITLVILSFAMIYNIASDAGAADATRQKVFTELIEENKDSKTIVIYQNNNTAVTKKFSTKEKRFLDGYQVINIEGKSFILTKL